MHIEREREWIFNDICILYSTKQIHLCCLWICTRPTAAIP